MFQELLANETSLEVTGPIKFIHQWVDMPEQSIEIQRENGTIETVSIYYMIIFHSFSIPIFRIY